jgi:hypothetical protein
MSERTDGLTGSWTSVVRAAALIPAKVPLGPSRRFAGSALNRERA